MKINLKGTLLSCIILSMGITLVALAEDTGDKFINKPWNKLNENERNKNRAYMNAIVTKYKNEEKLSFLLSLLDDQKTCFLPREALIQLGEYAKESLRKIIADRKRPMTTRSEALIVLAHLKDQQTIPLIEKDPILMKPISAYEEVHAPEVLRFHKNFLDLSMTGMSVSERVTFLSKKLKADEQIYVVVKELISLGKEAFPELESIISKKENDLSARFRALFVLKEIGNKSSSPVALSILKDEEETDAMRELAAVTLRVVGDESVIPDLEHVYKTWKPKEKGPYHVDKEAKKAIEEIKKRIKLKTREERKEE
ncbi:MAG: HEAT repeat domain-containing protein [Deltaproteobacteria bacterium]|nr:MAG: HEAT repeat domain-containing protein [Deltaproteobacteria bacterium]